MKNVLLIILVLFCYKVHSQEAANAFEMNQRLGRGINMGNAFEAPTESAWGNPWKPAYFRIMSELGFAHVRIPIRWSTPGRSMNTPPYTINQSFLNRIKQVVDTALKYQLHPVINMHHHESLFEDPDGQKDRFLAQWTQIADFFKDYSDSLVFEVLNEPHNNLTPQKWNVFFEDALQIIRENNPTRTILLGTALYGGLTGVPYLQIPDDPHIILSVHYYNPFKFTHQGASWVGNDAEKWLGTQWYDTEAERQTIIDDFNYTIQFAQEHNIPLHIGEFGAYSTADLKSRVRWTTFLARWFEEQNFSWAYWEFSAGFGIYNPHSGELLTPLADALLHDPMPEATTIKATSIFEQHFQQEAMGWEIKTSHTGQAGFEENQENLMVNITSGGTETWHVQLIKEGLSIEQGQMYRVTFSVKADDNPRHLTTYLGKASEPYNSYSGYKVTSLTLQEQKYSYTFMMTDKSDDNARIVFDLGLSTTSILLSFVKVEKLSMKTLLNDTEFPNIRPLPKPHKDAPEFENPMDFDSLIEYGRTEHEWKRINQQNFE